MDFEIGLFRIYERVMRISRLDTFCRILFCATLSLGILSLVSLVMFHSIYMEEGAVLKSAISAQVFGKEGASINFKQGNYTYNSITVYPEDIY